MSNILENGNQHFNEDREAEAKEQKMDTIMRQFTNQVQASGSTLPVPESTTCQRRKKKAKRFRSAFTTTQITAMENEFKKHPYINHVRRQQLAEELKITDRAIKVWFQNRRMKEKRDCGGEESTSSEDHIDSISIHQEKSTKKLKPNTFQKTTCSNSKEISSTNSEYSIHITPRKCIKVENLQLRDKLHVTHIVAKQNKSLCKNNQDKPENLCTRKGNHAQEYSNSNSSFNQTLLNGFVQSPATNNLRYNIYPPVSALHPMPWNRMNFVPIMPAQPGIQMCPSLQQVSVSTGAIAAVKKCNCDCHTSAVDMHNVRMQSTQPFMYIMPQTATNHNQHNLS